MRTIRKHKHFSKSNKWFKNQGFGAKSVLLSVKVDM
jgi:hypothetical protein